LSLSPKRTKSGSGWFEEHRSKQRNGVVHNTKRQTSDAGTLAPQGSVLHYSGPDSDMNCSTAIRFTWFVRARKRNKTPCVLTPAEIRMLADRLATRERTLVLLVASTGLRQSELFGLQWGDINFAEGTMNVTRSIVCGVVGPWKTESSQRPVPIHPLIVEALVKWREHQQYRKHGDWVFASNCRRGRKPYWGQAILRKYILHPNSIRQFQISLLESMAGTTGLEPATSAVTAERKRVTYWNQGERMAPFSSLRNAW
jgi:hypothetical protein